MYSQGLKPILPLAVLLSLMLAACSGDAAPGKPDLPNSVSPGWSMKNYRSSAAPEGLPEGEKPVCWKADYSGANNATAEVWACGFAGSGAFNAEQRTRAAANTVKFSRGKYLAVVRWNGGTRTDVTALMRAIEGALKQ